MGAWVGVTVCVCVIAWVRKGVCGCDGLDCCCKVCEGERGGKCVRGCDCVGVEGSVWVGQP